MRVHLKVVEGKPLGATIPLPPSRFVIGRDPGCQLRPKHESVGTVHCALSVDGEQLFVRDLGSGGGTLLNGRLLLPAEPATAYHGDLLQVGNLVFQVSVSGAGVTDRPQTGVSPADTAVPTTFHDPPPFPGTGSDDGESEESPSAIANRIIQQSLSKGPDPVKAVGSHLHAEMVDGIPWVAIEMARIIGADAALILKRELRDLAERPSLSRLVLDFRKVQAVSPEAADVLVAFHERLRGRGAKVKFCEVGPAVQRVLEAKGLVPRIPVCLDCHDAIWSSW